MLYLENILNVLNALRDDSGQDLVEYAMVMVLIGLALSASMLSVASNINAVFISLAAKLHT